MTGGGAPPARDRTGRPALTPLRAVARSPAGTPRALSAALAARARAVGRRLRVRAAALSSALALLAAPALLAGCPLPQPLPAVIVPTGAVAAPRILPETATPDATIVTACPEDAFAVSVRIVAENTDEPVEARWFVDYSVADPDLRQAPTVINAVDDATLEREVPALAFQPFARDDERIHVLELVVAYQFEPRLDVPLPNRTPTAGNGAQVFRWVFQRSPEPCPAPPAATP